MNELSRHTLVRWPRALVGMIVVMLVYLSPGQVSASDVDARLEELRTYLESCTRDFGYEPKRTRSFAEHEIAPGEARWRDCAYAGIRKIMVPPSAVPNSYDTLIALDRVMTREISTGKRTRSERQQRMQKMIDDILAKEKAAADGTSSQAKTMEEAELRKQRDQLVARQREIEKMRRIQSMTR